MIHCSINQAKEAPNFEAPEDRLEKSIHKFAVVISQQVLTSSSQLALIPFPKNTQKKAGVICAMGHDVKQTPAIRQWWPRERERVVLAVTCRPAVKVRPISL